MLNTIEQLLDAGFENRVISEIDVHNIFGGSATRQYALVNKALKKGELVRLRRGLYVIANKYRQNKVNLFELANHMVYSSYVSLESSLSYHGFIPEAVRIVQNVTAKRRCTIHNKYGYFEYYHLPVNELEFMSGVCREVIDDSVFLIASPLRALADYAYFHKIERCDVAFLMGSLRIEFGSLQSFDTGEFLILEKVYQSKKVLKFLKNLKKELGYESR